MLFELSALWLVIWLCLCIKMIICCSNVCQNLNILWILVTVLCPLEEGHYKNAFKFFAENNMNLEVIWVNCWEYGSRFLLLFDVVSRIPEDVQYVLHKLKIDGKSIDDDRWPFIFLLFISNGYYFNISNNVVISELS